MPSIIARGTRSVAIACLLAGALAVTARAEISQRESARKYAAELAEEIERVTAERDRALADLEAEKKKAKAAVDRTVGKAVAREAALTEARRRITELEAEIASLLEARKQSDADHAARETELADRASKAELARVEAEELLEETQTKARNDLETAQAYARAEAEELRAEIATVRAEAENSRRLAAERDEFVRQTNSLHARQLGDLQTHIVDLERTLASETEARLALESRAPGGGFGPGPVAERLATLERDLAGKEAELTALAKQSASDKRELRALRTAREGLERELQAKGAPDDAPFLSSDWAVEDAAPEELRRLLALERERRSTLEGELVRLSATGDIADRYRESWEALQAARADILLLSQRLDAEQAKREEVEAMLERARRASNEKRDGAPLDRLIDVASEHGRETERLAKELADANDHVAKLRGYLETMETPDGGGATIAKLDEENGKLKAALAAAEKTIGRLSGKAALAERLAELVYTRNP